MKKQEKEPTYASAQQELEKILIDLQDEKTTVDELAEKVRRAAFLIDLCKTRLRMTEEEVGQLLQ